MRKFLRSAVCLAVVCLVSARATASLENTHHDIPYLTGNPEQGLCSFCHVPHNAKSDKGLFSADAVNQTELGPVGGFCYSCHDGTVMPTAVIEAADGTLGINAITKSHGTLIKNISKVTGGMETIENVALSGLVKLDPVTKELPERLDCMVCHNVHSNEFPPFLKFPLEELCTKCHSGLDKKGLGRWTVMSDEGESNLAHPIGVPVRDSGGDKSRDQKDAGRSFHEPHEIFKKPNLDKKEAGDKDKHWEMGGHLFGMEQKISCSTCHSAHMPKRNLLVSEGTSLPNQEICAGCHSNGNTANPGITEGYHPVFDESLPPYIHEHEKHGGNQSDPTMLSSGTLELFVDIPPEFPLGPNKELTCESCHTLHGGVKGAKCLRSGSRNWAGGVICNECHTYGSYTRGKDWHHPISPMDYTPFGFDKMTSWAWGPGLPGDLSDGLQCTDCHSEWAKSAHNW